MAKGTAQQKLATTLSQEILQDPREEPYVLPSENQLCARFNVSRVTVRLVLSELQAKGLIYRQHGRGTFAHGRNRRAARPIALLMKSTQTLATRPVAEMIQGAQSVLADQRSGMVLLCHSPDLWLPNVASCVSGVLVFPHLITEADLEMLRKRRLPFLLAWESSHSGPQVRLGQRTAARQLTERLLAHGHRRLVLLTGCDGLLDSAKREGIDEALILAGLNPKEITEIHAPSRTEELYAAAQKILALRPRPTAVIAMDDSLAAMLLLVARQNRVRLPQDISLVSFHRWPYLDYVEPNLTTVHFDFFAAGQQAARNLIQAAQTGEPLSDVSFSYSFREGNSLGAAVETT